MCRTNWKTGFALPQYVASGARTLHYSLNAIDWVIAKSGSEKQGHILRWLNLCLTNWKTGFALTQYVASGAWTIHYSLNAIDWVNTKSGFKELGHILRWLDRCHTNRKTRFARVTAKIGSQKRVEFTCILQKRSLTYVSDLFITHRGMIIFKYLPLL